MRKIGSWLKVAVTVGGISLGGLSLTDKFTFIREVNQTFIIWELADPAQPVPEKSTPAPPVLDDPPVLTSPDDETTSSPTVRTIRPFRGSFFTPDGRHR